MDYPQYQDVNYHEMNHNDEAYHNQLATNEMVADERLIRPWGFGFGRPFFGFGRPFFGAPFLGGIAGGLLGASLIRPPFYGYYGYGPGYYGYGPGYYGPW
ncbi:MULTISPECIES: hypothetical protein [Clostridia]|uniref:hypothetical protein n=1 Tax=Clostridia TaxID=186801 RepID=UPI0018F62B9B|nr:MULTISPECIES: hypothetical protein [Clostridia]